MFLGRKKKDDLIKAVILSVIIFVLLFVCGAVLYKKEISSFDAFNDIRLDPIGLVHKKKIDFERRKYDVVLLGDSHAAYWNIKCKEVLNLGIPNQTSAQILLRSNMLKERVAGRQLIVVAGANDVFCVLTNKRRKGEVVERCLTNICQIVENHRSVFNEIYVMTITPLFKCPVKWMLLYDKSYVKSTKKLNNEISRKFENDSIVKVLDCNRIATEKMGNEKLSADGIHMNNKMYGYLDLMLDCM